MRYAHIVETGYIANRFSLDFNNRLHDVAMANTEAEMLDAARVLREFMSTPDFHEPIGRRNSRNS